MDDRLCGRPGVYPIPVKKSHTAYMGFYLDWVMMARLGCLTGDGWGWSGGGDAPKRRDCQHGWDGCVAWQ